MIINPLQQIHEQAEATFLPYGPDLHIVESYGEVEAEYAAIRKGVAVMDAPHRGVVILTGKDRLSFLHNKITNDTNRLQPGQGCYAYLLNLKGRITMDMNILHTEEATLVEIDHRLAPLFVEKMEKFVFTEDVRVLNGSEQLGRLTVLGPRSGELLKKVMDAGVETLDAPLRHSRRLLGKATVTVFRNDLCGQQQFELIVPRDQLVKLWEILHEAGGHGHEGGEGDNAMTMRAIGWSAFNTARIEAGTPLFGIDITDNHLPMETGHWYTRAVSVTKGCYLGQEIVARMHAHQTVARLFVGLKVQSTTDGGKLPVAGTDIFDPGEGRAQIGIVTSSCMSPMLGYVPVAMGYVKKAFSAAGKEVDVLAEGSREKALVSELPLWKPANT